MAELDTRRAEVLGNAAKTIQRQIRTYIARRDFVVLRRAAIQLQSCWRGTSIFFTFEYLISDFIICSGKINSKHGKEYAYILSFRHKTFEKMPLHLHVKKNANVQVHWLDSLSISTY